MTNELQVFSHEQFGEIEAILIDGKPHFPAMRCADMLGYANPRDAVARHTKGVVKHDVLTNGGRQEVAFISQGDLIRLITHSKLPAAVMFEAWIFDEVVPTVLRHGVYAIDELLDNPDMFINVLQKLKVEREQRRVAEQKAQALEVSVGVKDQQIAELQPKTSYYDAILNTKDAISVTKIAKDYGKSAVWLNGYLHDKGIQFKQSDVWLLYAKYAEQGYTSTRTHVHPGKDGEMHSTIHTYWTQKGRLFLYDLLKQDNILPLVEREDTQTSLVA
jgi:prophage antirepressor-like protein